MKKDELIKQNAILEEKLKKAINDDLDLRILFSKILESPIIDTSWGSTKRETYSWIEISAEIGKLINSENFNNVVEDVNRNKNAIEHAFKILKKNKNTLLKEKN